MTTTNDPAPPRISVIIPHLNQPENLARCIASIKANTRAADEIIVVDNGSQALPSVPDDVLLLREEMPGPGPARNLGVAQAQGDVLAFLDADCLATEGWLAEIADRIVDAEILGGDMRIKPVNPANLTPTEAYESQYSFRIARYIAEENFAATANLAVRRAVLDAVGPFAGLSVAEDRDWGHRAVAKGYTITYAPKMQVLHPAREQVADLFTKWDRQMSHDYGLIATTSDKLHWWLKALALGVSPLWEALRIARSDRLQGIGTRAKAIVTLTRVRLYRMVRMIDLALRGRPERLAAKWNRQG